MSDYLKDIYVHMGSSLVIEELSFESETRFYILEKFLRSIPRGRILDMGCGQGYLLKRISDYHATFGLEFDKGAAEIAKNRGLQCELADLNVIDEIPFDGLFDCIVCSEVCEHLLNPRNAYRIAHKKLKPDGLLVITVPNALPLFVRLDCLLGRKISWLHYPSLDTEATGHIRFYTTQSLSQLAKEEDFSVLRLRGVSWRFNGWVWPRICFWIGKLISSSSNDKSAMLVDEFLSRSFPSLSPGLMVIMKKK
jgi:2-polyprenyl-3-methyl-5-hydroxy-6-metoxy-1,4-benzoquinol methylase